MLDQLSVFFEPCPALFRIDIEVVRSEFLEAVNGLEATPVAQGWDIKAREYCLTAFAQMVRWLSREDAVAYCARVDVAVARLTTRSEAYHCAAR